MLIRTRLLLLGLTTIALPWAGCQYAREMESALRSSERQSLLAIAETIATSLQGRRDLLARNSDGTGSAEPPGPYDLEPVPLRAEPQLDARAEEWPTVKRAWKRFASPDRSRTLEVLTGTHERHLYLLIRSNDPRLVFDRSDPTPLESAALGDRLWLGFTDAAGVERQVFIAAAGAGAVRGRRIESADLGRSIAVEERRIEGAWRRPRGWQAELRVPLSMLGSRLGVLVDDRDRRGAAPISYGSLVERIWRPSGGCSPRTRTWRRTYVVSPERSAHRRGNTQRRDCRRDERAVRTRRNSPAQALLSQVYVASCSAPALAERVTEASEAPRRSAGARCGAGRSSSGRREWDGRPADRHGGRAGVR